MYKSSLKSQSKIALLEQDRLKIAEIDIVRKTPFSEVKFLVSKNWHLLCISVGPKHVWALDRSTNNKVHSLISTWFCIYFPSSLKLSSLHQTHSGVTAFLPIHLLKCHSSLNVHIWYHLFPWTFDCLVEIVSPQCPHGTL